VRPGAIEETVRDPADVGMDGCEIDDLAGGSPEHNASRLLDVLEGEPGPHRDAIVLGAALALEVSGRAGEPDEAVAMAGAAIDDGRALGLAKALEEFGTSEAGR
jgi:anthranilate phosphoribosyltransferase